MKKKKAASEFGDGLVQQLVYFADHFDNPMGRDIHSVACFAKKLKTHSFGDCIKTIPLAGYAKLQLTMVFEKEPKLFRDLSKKLSRTKRQRAILSKKIEEQIPHMIELWANGATDHLYGMHCLPKIKGKNRSKIVLKMDEKIYQLTRWGLRMGHGFRTEDTAFCTIKNFERLKALTGEIARLIDQHLGVKSDPGQWQ